MNADSRVECKNCKLSYLDNHCLQDIPTHPNIDYTNEYATLKYATPRSKYNSEGKCGGYIRKWWKFWVKE